jgi:hypothetical protein
MQGFRSIAGLALGFLIFVVGLTTIQSAVMSGQPLTPGYVLGCTGYGAIFGALGGLTAASIAGRSPVLHAAALSGIVALAALVHQLLAPGALWIHVAAALGMAPAAMLGGLARRAVRQQTE